MRKKLFCCIVVFVLFFMATPYSEAGSLYYNRNNASQYFGLWPDQVKLWGSGILSATGFNPIVTYVGDFINGTEITFAMVNSWYASLLVAQLTGRTMRVIFDDNTGQILSIIPQ